MKQRIRGSFSLVAVLLVAILITGCFGGETAKKYKLTVVVKDAAGVAIKGASVAAGGQTGETGEDGKVTFADLSGTVKVEVTAEGYKGKEKSFTVKKDDEITINLTTEEDAAKEQEIVDSVNDSKNQMDLIEALEEWFDYVNPEWVVQYYDEFKPEFETVEDIQEFVYGVNHGILDGDVGGIKEVLSELEIKPKSAEEVAGLKGKLPAIYAAVEAWLPEEFEKFEELEEKLEDVEKTIEDVETVIAVMSALESGRHQDLFDALADFDVRRDDIKTYEKALNDLKDSEGYGFETVEEIENVVAVVNLYLEINAIDDIDKIEDQDELDIVKDLFEELKKLLGEEAPVWFDPDWLSNIDGYINEAQAAIDKAAAELAVDALFIAGDDGEEKLAIGVARKDIESAWKLVGKLDFDPDLQGELAERLGSAKVQYDERVTDGYIAAINDATVENIKEALEDLKSLEDDEVVFEAESENEDLERYLGKYNRNRREIGEYFLYLQKEDVSIETVFGGLKGAIDGYEGLFDGVKKGADEDEMLVALQEIADIGFTKGPQHGWGPMSILTETAVIQPEQAAFLLGYLEEKDDGFEFANIFEIDEALSGYIVPMSRGIH